MTDRAGTVDALQRGGGGRYDLDQPAPIDWNDEQQRERYISERVRYLDRILNDDRKHRHYAALAWRELGFSTAGIAKRVDSTESTVADWLADWADQYGEVALEARPQSNPVEDLE